MALLEEKRRIKTDIDTVKLFRSDLEIINDLPADEKTVMLNAILQAYDDYAPRFAGASKRSAGMPDISAPPYNIPLHLSRKGKRIIGNIIQDISEYWAKCDQNKEIRSRRK